MLFFHGQSFEYIHECSYILKNKRAVEGKSYLSKREKCLCLLFFLMLPPKRGKASPKTPKKIQKLLKYFKTFELLRSILKFYTGCVQKANFLLDNFQQK